MVGLVGVAEGGKERKQDGWRHARGLGRVVDEHVALDVAIVEGAPDEELGEECGAPGRQGGEKSEG